MNKYVYYTYICYILLIVFLYRLIDCCCLTSSGKYISYFCMTQSLPTMRLIKRLTYGGSFDLNKKKRGYILTLNVLD